MARCTRDGRAPLPRAAAATESRCRAGTAGSAPLVAACWQRRYGSFARPPKRKEREMRLGLGSRVDCTDETFGKLVDVVIDPTSRRVTHLVVEHDRDPRMARLVPVELAEPGEDASGAVALRATVEEVRSLPPVHEVAYLRLDGFPVDDPDWDVGIEEVLALPYYASYDLEPTPVDYAARYDRVPKGEVEIRRASAVESADGHHLGDVDGVPRRRQSADHPRRTRAGPPVGAARGVDSDRRRRPGRDRRSHAEPDEGRGGSAAAGRDSALAAPARASKPAALARVVG